MADDTALDIRAARDAIYEHDWVKGTLQSDGGSLCLEGALRLVVFGTTKPWRLIAHDMTFDPEKVARYDAARGCLIAAGAFEMTEYSDGKGHCFLGPSLPLWNDHADRTIADVFDALDRAEKVAEQLDAGIELDVEVPA